MPEINIGALLNAGGLARRWKARPTDRMQQIAREVEAHSSHFETFTKALKDSCESYVESLPEARKTYDAVLEASSYRTAIESAINKRRDTALDAVLGPEL